MGDGSPGHFLIIEPQSGVLCLQAGKAVEQDIGGCFPRGLEHEEEARFEAMRLSVIEAGEDLASRIRAVAFHFASASRATETMSDTMEIGFILSLPAEAPVKDSSEVGRKTSRTRNPVRFSSGLKAEALERMPLDPSATSTRMYSRLDTASKLQTGVTAGATAPTGKLASTASADPRVGARRAGTGAQGITEEENARTAAGGYPVPGQRYLAQPQYDASGSTLLFDPVTRRLQAAALGPTGIGMDTVETGGNRGFNALDSGNVVVAGSVDFSRSYTGKSLANVPDDATSDRRAATANQKTGGDRAVVAINSDNMVGNVYSMAATTVAGIRSYQTSQPPVDQLRRRQ